MDNFVVYILYSLSSGKTYTGMTADLITRFQFHNSKSTKGFTLRFRPWTVIHFEFFGTKADALLREKILKSGKGRDWVKKNVLPYQLSTQDTYPLSYTSAHRRGSKVRRTITFLQPVKQKPLSPFFKNEYLFRF